MRPVRTLARLMLSTVFVVGGSRTLQNPARVAPLAKPVTDRMVPMLQQIHPRFPTEPEKLVKMNAAVQVAGGLMLATGHLRRPAALALAASLIPTTVAGHSFWNEENPAQRAQHEIQFMKNLGLVGGLLLAALDTEGRPGLRWRTGHRLGHGSTSVRRAVRTVRRDARIAMRSAATARRLPG